MVTAMADTVTTTASVALRWGWRRSNAATAAAWTVSSRAALATIVVATRVAAIVTFTGRQQRRKVALKVYHRNGTRWRLATSAQQVRGLLLVDRKLWHRLDNSVHKVSKCVCLTTESVNNRFELQAAFDKLVHPEIGRQLWCRSGRSATLVKVTKQPGRFETVAVSELCTVTVHGKVSRSDDLRGR